MPPILATDLDGTLIPNDGDTDAVSALAVLRKHVAETQTRLLFVTGRHYESVLAAIEQHDLPRPGHILCDVGSRFYRATDDGSFEHLADYDAALDQIIGEIDPDSLRAELAKTPGVRLQEPESQGRHKLSYYADAAKLEAIHAAIERQIDDRGLPYGIVSSVDPFNGDGLIDVMPAGVDKAFALAWWCRQHDIEPTEVIFAGDSGNDTAALIGGYRAIVVGNASRGLAEVVRSAHAARGWNDRLYLAGGTSTAGVVEGLRWFGVDIPGGSAQNRWGAAVVGPDRTRFRVWAPKTDAASVAIGPDGDNQRVVAMTSGHGGWHEATVDGCGAGTLYRYVLGPGGQRYPDPASRRQPVGVHAYSEVVDHRHLFLHDDQSRPTQIGDCIIYEVHVGCFTQAGTFASAIERLDELKELGVNTISLMPVAASAGDRNWGYDATAIWAPLAAYGTPADLARLIDAAHGLGMNVLHDVVYNHFGPEGNYLSHFGPYVSEKHKTVWGDGPNLDGQAEARQFIVDNAMNWLDEYHFDGLRVDAIHCIPDDSPEHLATTLGRSAREFAERTGRHVLMVAESNVYDARMCRSVNDGGHGFAGQWSDCLAHSLMSTLRPQYRLTNRTYLPRTDLAQVHADGYVYAGDVKGYRGRTPAGNAEADRATLVQCIQNHDFVGNHPAGHRFHQATDRLSQAAAAALLLLGPGTPMLFMGEEFCCEHPFQFFVDFGDERLRKAVNAGRRREYPQHDWSVGGDPSDERTFLNSKIGPAAAGDAAMRDWYRRLISLRRELGVAGGQPTADIDHAVYRRDHDDWSLVVRVDSTAGAAPMAMPGGEIIADSRVAMGQAAGGQLHPVHAVVIKHR